MSKFPMLFAATAGAALMASAPAAAQQFHPSDETRAAGQTGFVQNGNGCPAGQIRSNFSVCVDAQRTPNQNYERTQEQQQPIQEYELSDYDSNMINSCISITRYPPQPNRFGQQLDRRVPSYRGSYGSPYGDLLAQQQARYNACLPTMNIIVRYDGTPVEAWLAAPEHQRSSARRAWYTATVAGPQNRDQRQVQGVIDSFGREIADSIYSGRGRGPRPR